MKSLSNKLWQEENRGTLFRLRDWAFFLVLLIRNPVVSTLGYGIWLLVLALGYRNSDTRGMRIFYGVMMVLVTSLLLFNLGTYFASTLGLLSGY